MRELGCVDGVGEVGKLQLVPKAGESSVSPAVQGIHYPYIHAWQNSSTTGSAGTEQMFRFCSDFSGGYQLGSTLFEAGRVHPDAIGDDVVEWVLESLPRDIVSDVDVKAAFVQIGDIAQPIIGLTYCH